VFEGEDVDITEGTVRHLEALAALRLSDADRERMRAQLARILEYVEQLAALDVTDVPPTYHVISTQNVLRPDEVRPSLPPEDVLRNAPSTRGPFYRVPRFVGDAEEGS
jgi:aspartyl-tRNA(Asn)/glutamyl-tRNA(Gln) amidotransferase subunit C